MRSSRGRSLCARLHSRRASTREAAKLLGARSARTAAQPACASSNGTHRPQTAQTQTAQEPGKPRPGSRLGALLRRHAWLKPALVHRLCPAASGQSSVRAGSDAGRPTCPAGWLLSCGLFDEVQRRAAVPSRPLSQPGSGSAAMDSAGPRWGTPAGLFQLSSWQPGAEAALACRAAATRPVGQGDQARCTGAA